MKKKVLILGSGGREHALAWSMVHDKAVEKVYCAPGNGGTESIAENIVVNLANHQEVIRLVQAKKIDLTIVGPENPLANGIVDAFNKENLRIFGPDSYCAQLESSKLFARDIMAEKRIKQPVYYSCNTISDVESLKEILELPLVIKADGLAAGKGVLICQKEKEFKEALKVIFEENAFGDASSRLSLERCIFGEELSVFAICDGFDYKIIGSAQDHKRAYDGDKGPNTGGMGAYAPTPLSTPELMDRVGKEIIDPTLEAMAEKGHPYRGFLYIGLMLVEGEPHVIEFNVRMGDPEAQVILPLLKSSLFQLIWDATEGKLKSAKVEFKDESAVTIVIAAEGYPIKYKKGRRIRGLDKLEDNMVFHAGTKSKDHDIVTSGGRVLNAVGFGSDLPSAIENAYQVVKKVKFRDQYYRKDIGKRGLQYLKTKGKR
ncbi:MAG: phosphoribosylamine--glycine ligase [Candidatus Marinimicrobia bacterium]|jgi:phosphoribosylamine--glycine ligase|nr:phosphoribosylamine--glycine ligase [Candidatus Neomarinimicrobiota bacterium]MDP6936192.1 phosphoribosylamine--glycine ligase [Candidatus Neomarinimicrobiota bacterium]